MGFLTNAEEEALLQRNAYLAAMTRNMAKSVGRMID
jgi:N-acetylmuramoyl-L-alanine amidase